MLFRTVIVSTLTLVLASGTPTVHEVAEVQPVQSVDYYSVGVGAWHCLRDGYGYTGDPNDGTDSVLVNVPTDDVAACSDDADGSPLLYADEGDVDLGGVTQWQHDCFALTWDAQMCESEPNIIVLSSTGALLVWDGDASEFVLTFSA